MRLFKVPKNLFPQVKNRFPFVYLEHGRIEIDDSSVKWIDKTGSVVRLPVATIGSLFIGPGTSITHAAIGAISEASCTICWIGEDSLKFYAYAEPPTADTHTLYKQLRLAFNDESRVEVARKMFARRFPDADLKGKTLQMMMGMEGRRVKGLYAQKSAEYGVPWSGRSYIPGQSSKSEPINRTLTFLNGLLYGVVTSALLSGGYSPRVGFIHSGSPLPFVYDVADFYKEYVTIDLAFKLVHEDADIYDRHVVIDAFCDRLLERKILMNIISDVESVLEI